MSENKRKHIVKKISIILLSMAMVACFIILFIAASKDRQKATCKGVVVSLHKNNGKVFVNREEIKELITGDKILNPIGKKLDQLNIKMLERSVETYPWVKDAELYIDNQNILQISIAQRQPLARVFTDGGNSFYVDTEGKRVPVNGHFVIRVPVFTHFPTDAVELHDEDSILYQQITDIGGYIAANSFWMAQIEQVNINSDDEFELIPKVGNALIIFGDGTDVEAKFNKLITFYKKGLNNVGWGYYDTLNINFANQVVASRNGMGESPVVTALQTPNAPEGLQSVRLKIAESKSPKEQKGIPSELENEQQKRKPQVAMAEN